MEEKKRDIIIDVLKGIAVLAVLLEKKGEDNVKFLFKRRTKENRI